MNIQEFLERHLLLKSMMDVAKSLPPSETRDKTICSIECQLALLKLQLNAEY